MQNQTNYSVFLLKNSTMSNTIYCNTVVINNHTPTPTYKEILASPHDQPTAGAAKVPFYPNRSPLDCKRSNNDILWWLSDDDFILVVMIIIVYCCLPLCIVPSAGTVHAYHDTIIVSPPNIISQKSRTNNRNQP